MSYSFISANTASADVSPGNPTAAQRALVQEQRSASCMAANGFEYKAVVPNDVVLDEAFTAAVAAGKSGAELDAAMEQVRNSLPPDPNEAIVNSLPADRQAAWNSAYSGTDTTVGCAEADIVLSPDESAALDADVVKAESAVSAAEQSPAGQEALRRWVQCMSDHGTTVGNSVNPDEWNASMIQRIDEGRTPEEQWPEPPASNASASEKTIYETKVRALEAKEAASNSMELYVEQLNDACLPAYDSFFEKAYQDAFN